MRPLALALAALLTLAACSSGDPSTDSSSGSAGSGGAGGQALACPEVGLTRACVGPAACAGGQQCFDFGWSACQCGEAGAGGSGAAGSSGSAGTGQAGSGGSPQGAGGAGGGQAGSGGSSAGASQAGAGGATAGSGGAGGAAGACSPATACPAGQCGSLPDGCGGQVVCKACPAWKTCTAHGESSTCDGPCDATADEPQMGLACAVYPEATQAVTCPASTPGPKLPPKPPCVDNHFSGPLFWTCCPPL